MLSLMSRQQRQLIIIIRFWKQVFQNVNLFEIRMLQTNLISFYTHLLM